MIGYQSVKLKPGQFIFGRRSAAKATGLSEKVVRNCLKRLIKSEKATHQRAHHFSIITICNWDKYQCADIPKGPTKGPTRGPPGATDKNVKNGKNIYGELKNVKLTTKEHEKLISRFGSQGATQRIENLSLYLASKGKKYKSHYATILTWARGEKKEMKPHQDRICKRCKTGWRGMDLTVDNLCVRCDKEVEDGN